MIPINTEIDAITNCLLDANNQEVSTYYVQSFPPFDSNEWIQNWDRIASGNDGTYELFTVDGELQGRISYYTDNDYFYMDYIESAPHNNSYNNGSKKYTGVGAHLCAIACKLSYDLGYDGIIRFIADVNLTEHYESLGAVVIDDYDNTMEIDIQHALDLIDIYQL